MTKHKARTTKESGDHLPVSSIVGVVEKIVYANEESGWSVLRVAADSNKLPATVVGPLYGVRPGETLRLSGEWVKDPKYGRQFRAETYLSIQPKTVDGLESYLGSGLIPGIGKVMAKRLVDRFGLASLDVLDNHPERLVEVEGIGSHRAKKIRAAWEKQKGAREVMVFLRTYGISAGQSLNIYRRYGIKAVALLKSNPYRLADEMFGIGFQTADQIASRMGIERDSPARAQAGLVHTLKQAEHEGHVFLPRQKLMQLTERLLGVDGQLVADALARLADTNELVIETRNKGSRVAAVYRPYLYKAETGIASRLRDIAKAASPGAHRQIEKRIANLKALANLELSAEQTQAIREALKEKILIITGGPGTGKTTLIRALLEAQMKGNRKVLLAAPTGRAAKRLSTASAREARTLHRLLEFDPRTMRFQRHRDRQLEADSIIIDESSMLDCSLTFHLLQAVPDTCQLIFVGDIDQLPPVGPGKVLSDFIASGVISVVKLKQIFRQSGSGLIVENAHRIRRGQYFKLEVDRPVDFYFIERKDPEELLTTLDHLVSERIPRRFGFNPKTDLQLLSPMRRGSVGLENLNTRLQHLVNSEAAPIELSGERLRVGDRVMQVRNNYEIDVFNGDIGIVIGPTADGESVRIDFDGRLVEFSRSDLDEIVLAYACSVHKAQGSEFPCVILILHGQHHVMLQRNLLYTGVTRGRDLVIVLGETRAVRTALGNDRPKHRYTGLSQRVRAALG